MAQEATVSIRIPADQMDQLRKRAKLLDVTVSQQIRQAVRQHLLGSKCPPGYPKK